MLGFAAGVMLVASTFSLIVPGLEAAAAMYGGEHAAAFTVAAAPCSAQSRCG
jgi:ZIP family zinc transporter